MVGSKQFKVSDQSDYRIKNAAVKSITFDGILTADAANEAITFPAFDLEKVIVTITTKRGSKETVNYKGKLMPGALGSAFGQGFWNRVSKTSADKAHITTLAAAVGVTETAVQPGRIDFPRPIIVKGENEEIIVDVYVESDAASATNVSTTASYLLFSAVEGVHNSYEDSIIELKQLDNDQDSVTFNLGDNIEEVIFLNLDKTDVLTASKVLKEMTIRSDRYNIKKTYEQLLSEREEQFPKKADSEDRDQSFMLFGSHIGTEMDNAIVELSLNTSNIATGKCWLFVRRYVTDAQLVARADIRGKNHRGKFLKKFNIKG